MGCPAWLLGSSGFFSYFQAYHQPSPLLLRYMIAFGLVGFPLLYLLRFVRSSQSYDDLALRLFNMSLLLLLAVRHRWPEHLKAYYLHCAYGAMTVALPLTFVFTSLKNGGGTAAVGNTFMAVFLLMLLADWRNFIVMLLMGFAAAAGLYVLTDPHPELPVDYVWRAPVLLVSVIGGNLFKFALEQATAKRVLRAYAQRAREQVAREEAQHTLEEKTRFMAAITHDLQQPIYALSLATESMVRRRMERLEPETLVQMQSALHSAGELLASLAMNVRLERAALRPEIEDFSVQHMLERMDAMFAARAQQQRLRWRVLPCLAVVRSDPVMLERMVCNLISNAMRYTKQGAVLLSCRKRAAHLLIQVWDTGPGIPEHERSTIFDAYHRGSAAQPQDKGLGLGLSIVSRCAHLLDIRVELRSVPGRGSRFELRVPLANDGA